MTTGELLSSESTVSNTTALIHLQNLDGTGGGGETIYIPYTDISVTFIEPVLKVTFEEQMLSVEFIEDILNVTFDEPIYNVTFDEETTDISITCE